MNHPAARLVGRALLWRLPFLAAVSLAAQPPAWIWHPNAGAAAPHEVRWFRRVFTVTAPAAQATLSAAGDDEVTVYLNGTWLTATRDWQSPARVPVGPLLKPGTNVLAARAENYDGPAGFIARLEVGGPGGETAAVVTDTNWLAGAKEEAGWQTLEFPAPGWVSAREVGPLGVPPWGDVFSPPLAAPASSLTVLPGFKVELLRSALEGEGSWICLTVDGQGRLIISPQEEAHPLLRVTLSEDGSVRKVEPIAASIRQAMGLCYAHSSLYANARGPQGPGLYLLRDANNDDQFGPDEVRLLEGFRGEGEHGYHAVVAGPAGRVYVMNGNMTKLPAGLAPQSPHRHYAEDLLLPRQWDAGGAAVGILAPGGYILRTDPQGDHWELFAAGFRNAYDFAFNAQGELFTFDSDAEGDWGLPWYRPIRVLHCVSGADYGWRSGTGAWPAWYADSLPSVLDVGIGSPTGVKFGTRSRYPDKYRKALFALDWSYGRILAVHLTPQGATYTGTCETFLRGRPLTVTDVEFGADGAMYFITGGRGTQSGLYRVAWTSAAATAQVEEEQGAQARALRRRLEALHGRQDPAVIEAVWPHLDDPDRWIRSAARVALEGVEIRLWQAKALAESRVRAALTALLALARVGVKELQSELVAAVQRCASGDLTEEQNLEALRVLQVAFVRLGRPSESGRQAVLQMWSLHYPAPSERLNRELSQLLIYLEAPDVVSKTLALIEAAPTLEEQVHYLFHLRTLERGWTLDGRRAYFHWLNRVRSGGAHAPEVLAWFRDAGRAYTDGASFQQYVANLRRDAVARLTEAELRELKPIITGQALFSLPTASPRQMVQEWTFGQVAPHLAQAERGRSFARGQAAFRDAQCLACHRFGQEGGSVGPDLTAVSFRLGRREVLESILEPSKVVSDQYQNTTLTLKDGEDLTGRIIDETADKLVLITNALTGQPTEVPKQDIAATTASKLSPMPEGLANILSLEEILDLLAYVESGGQANYRAFAP